MNILPFRTEADVAVNYARSLGKTDGNGADSSFGMYFYHSDLCGSRAQSQACLSYAEMKQSVRSNHLGSASWITNQTGNAVQHLQYLPFGERYIDQRTAGYQERFTFSGKERDEETGFGYFGARYHDSELLTGWMSVDPMSDKYPSISPYAYCAWNPVKLVDPDGRIDSISPGLKPLIERIRHDDLALYNQLEESSDRYRIVYGDKNNGAGGSFTYVPNADNVSEGFLEISIHPSEDKNGQFSQLERLAHEMRHAKQYEDKQLGFMVQNGVVKPIGYDFDDEVQCYEYADRYADLKSQKSHNDWKKFVISTYSKECCSTQPETPLEWVNKTFNSAKNSSTDPSIIVRELNAVRKGGTPYLKMRL